MQKTFRKMIGPVGIDDFSGSGGAQLSDADLYQLCCQFGTVALEARRKFLGLLPEVARRRLYEKHGFSSIFVFAAKVAGVSEEQVRRTLNLEERFRNMPVLRLQLVNGEVSVNKLARVAAVATSETAEFWAEKVKILAKSALETLVRDEKFLQKSFSEADNLGQGVPGHINPQELGQKSIFGVVLSEAVGQSENSAGLKLNLENLKRLLELQNKGIDINSLIAVALDNREKEISEEKQAIVDEQNGVVAALDERERKFVVPSRYIPVRVKRVIEKEFGKKCAIGHCKKLAVNIHHTARYALGGGHNPNYLAPLCREHHQIAHAVDGKFWQERGKWSGARMLAVN